MSSVDNRIVNMQFNNKQFESGVTQSTKSLTGLESTLSKTAQGKGLSSMANGVDGVKNKFSLMKVAGVAAVATIASKATLAGISLVKSFTIDPIKAGWDEYNTNLKSIQTVMANTGKSIKPVQAALDELNTYSDLTIYNFSEMAKNVGTFSAAGVGLKDSVSAIKGISNMAALSGSTSQQASTAMYQLSQAIAAGRVNLQDWNSVVNAGMGGKNLQTALITTGIAMGEIDGKTVKWGKNIKIAGEAFRQSISSKPGSEPWLTSDVLVKTLALMDGRLSMTAVKAKLLAQNLKLPVKEQLTGTEITKKANEQLEKSVKLMEKQGYTPEQIKSIKDMAVRAYDSATVVKTLPQLMGVIKESIGSVWAQAFTGIVGNFEESKKMWTDASNAIGKATIALNIGLTNLIGGWRTGIDGISGRTAVIDGVKAAFYTLRDILGVVKKAFIDVFPPGGESGLAKVSIGFMNLMQALRPSASTLEKLRSIFGGIFAAMHIGFTIVKAVAGVFGALLGIIFQGSGPATGGILSMLAAVGEAVKGFDKWLSSGTKIKDMFTWIGNTLGPIFQPLIDGIQLVGTAFSNLASGEGMAGFMGPFNDAKAKFSEFGNTVYNAVNKLAAPLGGLAGIFDRLKSAINTLKPFLSGIGPILEGAFKSLPIPEFAKNIVSGIVKGMGGSAISLIKSAATALANAIPESIKSALGISSPAAKLIPIGVNIVEGIMQGTIDAIQSIPALAGKIKSAFMQLFGGMDSLDIAALMNSIFSGAMIISITRFTHGFANIGKSISGTFNQLKESLKDFPGGGDSKPKQILQLAIAIGILAVSLLIISRIPMKQLAMSLGAIALLMTLLVKSLSSLAEVAKGEVNMAILAASIILISGAMINLAIAVAILGSQDMESLAKGILGMALIMSIMVKSMQGLAMLGPGLPAAAAGIAIVSGAMVLLAGAVFLLGSMSLETLAKGIMAMAFVMNILTGAMSVLVVLGPGVASAGAGILMAATAMSILAAAVLAFGSMDISTLAIGMGAVALAMTIFVVSLGALGTIGPAVLAAGGAMIMMSVALGMLVPVVFALGSMDWDVLAKGLGAVALIMIIFVAGVAALGAVATYFGPGLMMLGAALALAGLGMLAFGTGFAIMAAVGVAGVAVLVVAFHAFMALLPTLATQVAAAFVVFLEVLAKAAPRARAAMSTIIKHMIGVVRDSVPELAKLLSTMITAGIVVLRKAIPQFVELGFTVIDRFLQSAERHAPSIIRSVTSLIVTFLNGIGNASGRIADAGLKMIIKFLNGMTNAINNNADDMRRAGLDLAMAIVNGMTGGLLGAGISMVKNAASAIANAIPGPIRKIMGLNSPSRVAWQWGEWIGAGLAGGLMSSIKKTVGATVAMANAVIAAGDSSVAKAQSTARLAQARADRAQAAADATKYSATRIPGNTKAAKARRAAVLKTAAAQQKTATAAQKAAESATAAVTKAQEWSAADLKGKGDIQSAKAEATAKAAAKMLARASSEAAAAKRLMSTNRTAAIALAAKSRADANTAKRYAAIAESQRKDAARYYATEVNERIKAIEDARKAEEQAIIDQAELDAADAQGKADILNKRAEANQAKADTAAALAKKLMEDARKLASTNATAAMKLLDESEKAAAEAKTAADEAKKQKDEANQATGQTGTGGTAGPITPSRNVLEDAASVVDRYTASLEAASVAAQATAEPIQYVQNNYSPVALTASEVYRQTNNLLALQEIKMGVKPT